jgi:hypothetical protein
MKRLIYLALIGSLSGCLGGGNETTSKLKLNADAVNFCDRVVGESYVWNNLQLRNTGKGPLTVKSIQIRGDQGCAFQCFYDTGGGRTSKCPRESGGGSVPPVTIFKGGTLLLRVIYEPGAEEYTDRATLVIATDADNLDDDGEWHNLLIPLCGHGVADLSPEGDAGPDDGEDAGVSEGDAGMTGDCGDCGKPLKKGAASCAAD